MTTIKINLQWWVCGHNLYSCSVVQAI